MKTAKHQETAEISAVAEPTNSSRAVRMSFWLSESEYEELKQTKRSLTDKGIKVKKSDLVRIAVIEAQKKSLSSRIKAIDSLPFLLRGKSKAY